MPRIAPQHSWKDKDHVSDLQPDWPEDCYVQWGSSGIVFGGNKGARSTAFFEAMPKEGGFIRGEGPTIREAEKAALRQFKAEGACNHLWGRGKYTNGGCICRRCGAFRTNMHPITVLGSWRKPICSSELDLAMMMNGLGPSPHNKPRDEKFKRRIYLRLRRAGFDLPEMPKEPQLQADDFCGQTPFAAACSEVIYRRLHELGGTEFLSGNGDLSSMNGFFNAMSFTSVKWGYEDWLKAQEGESAELKS
ncbi:hypothetical protein KUV57_12370 [Epibacterium sp. DP7N7-1]|nr:hypothetical protein [Epibacterium sp. DP7N7-1]